MPAASQIEEGMTKRWPLWGLLAVLSLLQRRHSIH